jgi:hypothetical protein
VQPGLWLSQTSSNCPVVSWLRWNLLHLHHRARGDTRTSLCGWPQPEVFRKHWPRALRLVTRRSVPFTCR